DDVFKLSVGHGQLTKHDDIRLGALHSRNASDALDPALGNKSTDVDVVHVTVPDPNIGLTVVHQQTGLANQAEEQAPLKVNQHDGKSDAQQRGQQFTPVG